MELIDPAAFARPQRPPLAVVAEPTPDRNARAAEPRPAEEAARLTALRHLAILDTPSEAAFDEIATLARTALQAAAAQVSFVDADRVWYKASLGLAISELPRRVAFCSHAVMQDRPFVVADAQRDPRYRDHPLVAGAPCIRFCAAHPIAAPSGELVGAVSVLGLEPREPTAAELAALRLASRHATSLLALRAREAAHRATLEELASARAMSPRDVTLDVWNRDAVMDTLARARERAVRRRLPLAVLRVDLDDFGVSNVRCGRIAGDQILRETARRLQAGLRPYDMLGREREDEFIAVFEGVDEAEARAIGERLVRAIGSEPFLLTGGTREVTASAGIAWCSFEAHAFTASAMSSHAEHALRDAKVTGKNRLEFRAL